MSYHRPLSPGGRRIHNPGRVSDSVATPSSYYQTPSNATAYTNPRASTGVIPISTQTFVNVPPPSSSRNVDVRESRPAERYDSYSGRPRRTSLIDAQRASSATAVNAIPARSRPTVVQNDAARPSSPPKTSRDKEYYITPASSSSKPKVEHKKLYSVDDGTAKLVADIDVSGGAEPRERPHRRRDSNERSGYKGSARRPYHLNGGVNKPRDKTVDDEDAYSYTDAAGMYRDTEPRWRARRGSLDRGNTTAHSRERPSSMMADSGYDPRTSSKDNRPPPSTRGWDKLNDGLGRARSVRDQAAPRSVAQSPTRGRYADVGGYSESKDPYYIPPRTGSRDGRANTIHYDRAPEPRYDQYDQYDDRREPRRERRGSVTRTLDRSVERRGFGVRPSSRDPYGRASDESFEKKYRDSGFVEPHRRDTAPNIYHEEKRVDQEKKDRILAERLQNEQWDREDREREARRKDDDRVYDREREYERERERPRDRERESHVDRERERERERIVEREPERERERHHHRRDTDRDRDRDYNRKENGDKDQQSGLAKVATGGLAGAAAAFGLGKLINKDKDKKDDRDRDSDRERERVRDRDEKRDRERDHDPERNSEREPRDRERERDRPKEWDREAERRREDAVDADRTHRHQAPESYSDEGVPHDREPKRDQYRDNDRGLGFAFEGPPEPSRFVPPPAERERERDRDGDRERDRGQEREHDARPVPAAEMPKPAVDPEEDYRRRMEQVQRELGVGMAPQGDSSYSDPDAERQHRQREREQRLRERTDRGRETEAFPAFGIVPGVGSVGIHEVPPPPAVQRSFDDESEASRGTDLRRKPSILDMPMTTGPAQIIDNSMSDKRETRVRIVDPPTEEEEKRPKGILKKPTEKFPEHQHNVREGVAPLKDATKKGIPPGARWTKIDRKLVNPESLEEAKERYEERMDCVIVLRVLTKEEIQKLADRTAAIREARDVDDDSRTERSAARRHDRKQRDEYSDRDSEDEYAPRAPKMLEAPASAGAPSWADSSSSAPGPSWAPKAPPPASASTADFTRDHRDRRREPEYVSSGGRRE